MAELADALDLGSSGVTRAGSTPVSCTIDEKPRFNRVFLFEYILGQLCAHFTVIISNRFIMN